MNAYFDFSPAENLRVKIWRGTGVTVTGQFQALDGMRCEVNSSALQKEKIYNK